MNSMFDFTQFRFRSPERDKATDQARIGSIRGAIRSAMADAEKELSGLRRRLENARRTAGMLLGKMEGGGPDKNATLELKRVEERLIVAERRIVELRKHLAALQRIENIINVEFPPLTATERETSFAQSSD
jgi:hypothetical protein